MSQRADHLQNARHNQEFAISIKATQPDFCDWAVIALFYSALHLVEAYLADMGEHPENHADRFRALQEHGVLSPIWGDYRELRDYSEDARYRCISFTHAEVDSLETEAFKRVQDLISGLIN